jgi:hypothetical protein
MHYHEAWHDKQPTAVADAPGQIEGPGSNCNQVYRSHSPLDRAAGVCGEPTDRPSDCLTYSRRRPTYIWRRTAIGWDKTQGRTADNRTALNDGIERMYTQQLQ